MHGSIRDRLEALLSEGQSGTELGGINTQEFSADCHHLKNCAECAEELAAMRAQSQMMRLLRAPESAEPTAGFYARVIQRIEERAKESMWAAIIYSPLSSRIAYASLTIALLLGTYVIAAEQRDGHLTGTQEIALSAHYDAPVAGNQSQSEQRNAVLQNFASH